MLFLVSLSLVSGFVIAGSRKFLLQQTTPQTLPPPTPTIPRRIQSSIQNDTTKKKIPRLLWISYRHAPTNLTDLTWYMRDVVARNPMWDVYLYGDYEQKQFMNVYFANTSILWAYTKINPKVGVMYSDIFRYCVLYMFGGVYLDDDASFQTPLDDFILDNDTLILTNEEKMYRGKYAPWYHLSDEHMSRTFCAQNATCSKNLFARRNVAQWMLLCSPQNSLMEHAINNIVELVHFEYNRRNAIWLSDQDLRADLIYHITGPVLLTATAREFVLKYPTSLDVPRMTGDTMFTSIGAKAKHDDHTLGKGQHYTVVMTNTQLLSTYILKNESKYYHGRFVLVARYPMHNLKRNGICVDANTSTTPTLPYQPQNSSTPMVHGNDQLYYRVINDSTIVQYPGSCSFFAAYVTARTVDIGFPFSLEFFPDFDSFRRDVLTVLQAANGNSNSNSNSNSTPNIIDSPSIPMPPGRPHVYSGQAGKRFSHVLTRPINSHLKYSCHVRGFGDLDTFHQNFTDEMLVLLPKYLLPEIPYECTYAKS